MKKIILSDNNLPLLGYYYYNNNRTTIIELTNTVPMQLRLYIEIIILLQNIIRIKTIIKLIFIIKHYITKFLFIYLDQSIKDSTYYYIS
jgi:hypothetical protein